MGDINLKRKQLEHRRVETARLELEFKIEERLEEIKRLQAHVQIQKQKEEELLKEIQNHNRGE